jgi:hypothetical protein
MKQVIVKQEVKREIFGLQLFDEQDSLIGGELDKSREIEIAEINPRRLHVRPFLDFRDEE